MATLTFKNKELQQQLSEAIKQKVAAEQEKIVKKNKQKNGPNYRKVSEYLHKQYPKCFTEDYQLLAVGIHKQIQEKDRQLRQHVHRVLAKYINNPAYKKNLEANLARHNLDGSIQSEEEFVYRITTEKFKNKDK